MSGDAGHCDALPVRVVDGCVIVRVRLTPKSSLDAVGKIIPTAEGPALHIRVRALPSDGAANAAAGRLMARWLNVSAGCVRLSSGSKSRVKLFTIDGDPHRLMGLIADKLGSKTA